MPLSNPTQDEVPTSAFLSLPAELRNRIYEFAKKDDLEHLAETHTLPALLSVDRQVEREYASIFLGGERVRVDAYYSSTDTWAGVCGVEAKMAVLRESVYTDLSEFWSLASARRFCQRVCFGRDVRRGILTIATSVGLRRWQWTIEMEV